MARIARLYHYKGSIGVKFNRFNISPKDNNADETYLAVSEFYRRYNGAYFLRKDK